MAQSRVNGPGRHGKSLSEIALPLYHLSLGPNAPRNLQGNGKSRYMCNPRRKKKNEKKRLRDGYESLGYFKYFDSAEVTLI